MQHFLSSGDLIADRRFEFAKDLEKRGDLAFPCRQIGLQVLEIGGFAGARQQGVRSRSHVTGHAYHAPFVLPQYLYAASHITC